MGTKATYANEQVVRLVALGVVLLTALWLVSGWQGIGVFLSVDFFLRAFTGVSSPLALAAKWVSGKLGITPVPIFAPPKRFAAGLGFIISLTTIVLLRLDIAVGGYVVGGTLIFCAVLESIFRICLGCYVFNWIVVPLLSRIQNKKS